MWRSALSTPNPEYLAAYFWPKVAPPNERGCLCWTAGRDKDGYGIFGWRQGRRTIRRRAHRLAYTIRVGPIPDGCTLDHMCRNRACINPEHLEPVPRRVNILRGDGPAARQARKTHCKRGHPFDEANTLHYRGGRYCRTCRRMRRRGELTT